MFRITFLLIAAFQTSFAGSPDSAIVNISAIFAFISAFSHAIISIRSTRDVDIPRLGDTKTIYEYSSLLLVGFTWLLLRITPHSLIPSSQAIDIAMSTFTTIVLLYGGSTALRSKDQIAKESTLPLSQAKQDADIILNGNVALSIMAGLFLPFFWCLALRGDDWWTRVQLMYPNQLAYFVISVLAVIIGNNFGLLLYSKKDFLSEKLKMEGKNNQVSLLVGLASLVNALLFIAPEIAFHATYGSNVSELSFYRQ